MNLQKMRKERMCKISNDKENNYKNKQNEKTHKKLSCTALYKYVWKLGYHLFLGNVIYEN